MKEGKCPSCGAPVDFAAGSSRVKVCEHCNTVVLRGEANLESMGKVAELADTESPLRVGLFGRIGATGFRVAGRIQRSFGKGAWDEWFLALDDGTDAWLSESEGQWNLMTEQPEPKLPAYDTLQPLSTFSAASTRFVVEEVGEASTVSAEGELPSFERVYPYADCTGPGGAFGSIDYGGEEPTFYKGKTLALEALGFDKSELSPTPRKEALKQARCTQCNGPLDLKAPDLAKRVACPYCGALLDVSQGQLAFLQLLDKPKLEPRIPLGAQGKLHGTGWTCLAFLIRSCNVEGTRYEWEEYLLWNVAKGFRWLMCSNGHWTYLTPVGAGDVMLGQGMRGRTATYGGETYRRYQSVNAVTDYVVGECYWEVEAGERAFATEYVAPPKSLNFDQTATEVTVTLGEMLPRAEVQAAFGLKQALRQPTGVASAQVNPWAARQKGAWKWTGIWAAAMFMVFIAFNAMVPTGRYLNTTVDVPLDAKSGSPEAMIFSAPFEVPKKVPLEVQISCPEVSNSWCGVQVDLINEKTDEIISVYAEPSYYFGSDSDGSWSEGSSRESKTTADIEPGTYVARTTVSFDAAKPVHKVDLAINSDGPSFCCFFFFLLMLFVYPIATSIFANQFEARRWADSVFQTQKL